MAYDSLRPYLDVLEQQGKMRWVDKEVDKDWEIGAIARMMFCALPEADRCGLGFRNIKGFPNGQVVTGVVASSHELMATALQCDPDPEKIRTRIIDGLNEPIEPVVIDTGPCKEVVLRSDEIDLQDFPIPVWTPGKDAGPYLTPLWVTKDPDTGQRNIGIRRCQIKGRDRTAILFGAPDGGGAIQFAKWRARGEHMPAAIFMGTDPVHYLVAPGRYGTDELAIAGGIRGEPIELVKCETVDLEVPATAEIVIEGEILIDTVEPEGPFGEFTGHMAGGGEAPIFRVKCITHRKDPILLGVVSQFPPSESSLIRRVLLEADLLHHLRHTLGLPGISDAHVLEAGGSLATLWLSIEKKNSGHVDRTAFAAMSYFGTIFFKWIVVTDDDIDINDPFMRDWVMAWRVRPERDMRIIADTTPIALDPSAMQPGVERQDMRGAKVIIDATRKWDFPEFSLPPRNLMEQVREGWDAYGLPPLGRMKLPRSG